MDVLYQKIGTALLSCILSIIFGSIPMYLAWKASKTSTLTQYSRVRTALSLLTCLSAGVFLGTCLLELFPEVQIALMQAFRAYGIPSSFPFAQFVTAVGLFIVLTIETLLFSFHGIFQQPHSKVIVNQSVSNVDSIDENRAHSSSASSDEVFRDRPFRPSQLSFSLSESGEKPFRAFILFFALSLHTFFEGLTCGLEIKTNFIWTYAIALCIHKPLIAIGISISFLRTTWGSMKFVFLMNFIFSLLSAVGITIGTVGVMYLSYDINAIRVVTGILQGLASGSFLYVVFIEILPFEMASHAEGYRKLSNLFALAFGFGITVAMEMLHQSNEPMCSL